LVVLNAEQGANLVVIKNNLREYKRQLLVGTDGLLEFNTAGLGQEKNTIEMTAEDFGSHLYQTGSRCDWIAGKMDAIQTMVGIERYLASVF
jgi:hypothetical protein